MTALNSGDLIKLADAIATSIKSVPEDQIADLYLLTGYHLTADAPKEAARFMFMQAEVRRERAKRGTL